MGFQTALSALKASSTAIDTVGNNLANLNTTGFKRSVVSFSDIMNSLGSSGNTQVGAGVGRAFTDRLFTQGLVTSTNNPLNAAVQGSGFFVVRPASAETGAASTGVNEYTRDGHFQIGSNGFLVTPFNSRVQGWNLNPQTGAIDSSGPVQDITIPLGSSLPPVVTST